MPNNKEPKRGFAALTPERRREIARLGGLAVQAGEKAHRYNSETGRIAGKKGGRISSQNRQKK